MPTAAEDLTAWKNTVTISNDFPSYTYPLSPDYQHTTLDESLANVQEVIQSQHNLFFVGMMAFISTIVCAILVSNKRG